MSSQVRQSGQARRILCAVIAFCSLVRVVTKGFRVALALLLFAVALASLTPCATAQELEAGGNAEFYVSEYARFVSQLQEVKFKYSGHLTRSTSSEGVVGKWENQGTIRHSRAQSSFHCTLDTAFTPADMPRSFLGTRERLSTPERYLDVSVVTRDDGESRPRKRTSVISKSVRRKENWVGELQWHELATLLGYSPFEHGEQTLLEIARNGRAKLVQDHSVGSRHLVGFSALSGDIQLRVLFDPTRPHRVEQLQVSRVSGGEEVGEIVKATTTILDAAYSASKLSRLKLVVALDRSGGAITPPKELELATTSTEIEPTTWDYQYDLSDFTFRGSGADLWFDLDNPIPDATRVRMEDSSLAFEWRDNKIRAIPKVTLADIENARFKNSHFQGRAWWIVINVLFILLIAVWITIRSRRRALPYV